MLNQRRWLGVVLGLLMSASCAQASDADRNWGQWRGPRADGTAPHGTPALNWSETENVSWKVPIPGQGNSTPVVWGDRIFVMTAVSTGKKEENFGNAGRGPERLRPVPVEEQEFVLLCLDRASGDERWRQVATRRMPHEGHHRDNSHASASPITDGKRVYAYYGSHGIFCYDLDGKLLWDKTLGTLETRNSFGEGASPALHGDTLVVVQDQEGDSFIYALDAVTGAVRWKQAREEDTGWSTPLIVEHGGRTEVVVNGSNAVRSYDLASGELLWLCAGQTVNAIPSPVTDGKTVYVMSGFRGNAVYAIALGHTGDLAGTDAVRWTGSRGTSYVPSPVLSDGRLTFFQRNDAILSCFDAATGEPHYAQQRLEGMGGVYASPVAAGGRVYLLDREGVCVVLEDGPAFKVLATNRLDDRFDASPAVVGTQLFLRGQKSLYCVEE